MSGLEVIGSVASVLQLAATVYSISKTLYEVNGALSNAPSDIKDLARDLETFSDELRLLSALLDEKNSPYSDTVYKLTAKIIGDCATICQKIDRVLKKLRSGSVWSRVKWLYKEKEIMKLLARLRDLKVSLLSILFMLGVLKVDHKLDTMGVRSSSLLEGGVRDENVAKQTAKELEDARQKLEGITMIQNQSTASSSTLSTQSSTALKTTGLFSVAPSNGLKTKSVAAPTIDTGYSNPLVSCATMPIETFPVFNAMMNPAAMDSVQSFHTALSHFECDNGEAHKTVPSNELQDHSKGNLIIDTSISSSSASDLPSQQSDSIFYQEWRNETIESAMKHFKVTREEAEAYTSSLRLPPVDRLGNSQRRSVKALVHGSPQPLQYKSRPVMPAYQVDSPWTQPPSTFGSYSWPWKRYQEYTSDGLIKSRLATDPAILHPDVPTQPTSTVPPVWRAHRRDTDSSTEKDPKAYGLDVHQKQQPLKQGSQPLAEYTLWSGSLESGHNSMSNPKLQHGERPVPSSSVSSSMISPAIRPLLPGDDNVSKDTASLLLASKSNYQNILEGSHLVPSTSDSTELSTSLTSKRTSHKISMQGRRNRINTALKQIASLLPREQEKDGIWDGEDYGESPNRNRTSQSGNSKATTVEQAAEYIKQLKRNEQLLQEALAKERSENELKNSDLEQQALGRHSISYNVSKRQDFTQTDDIDVPPSLLRGPYLPQNIPNEVKTWGQLKHWVTQNHEAGPEALMNIIRLQNRNYENLSSQKRDMEAVVQGAELYTASIGSHQQGLELKKAQTQNPTHGGALTGYVPFGSSFDATSSTSLTEIDAQIQLLQQQRYHQRQRQVQEQQRNLFAGNSRIESLQMLGNPPQDYTPDLNVQQRVQSQGLRAQEMEFTPLVSPAVTPLDAHFSVPELNLPGAYFSPLSSPALHAKQEGYSLKPEDNFQGSGLSVPDSGVVACSMDLDSGSALRGESKIQHAKSNLPRVSPASLDPMAFRRPPENQKSTSVIQRQRRIGRTSVKTRRVTSNIEAEPEFVLSSDQVSQLWWRALSKLDECEPAVSSRLRKCWRKFDQEDDFNSDKPCDDEIVGSAQAYADDILQDLSIELEPGVMSSQSYDSLSCSIDRIREIMMVIGETLNFKVGAFVWVCICESVVAVDESGADLGACEDLFIALADVATLVARYNVMESMYQQWPGMTLEPHYEDALVSLCIHIFRFLDKVITTLLPPARPIISEDLTRLIVKINEADAVCREFSVTFLDCTTTSNIEDLSDTDSDGTLCESRGTKRVFEEMSEATPDFHDFYGNSQDKGPETKRQKI
ncbi:hypothetical protein EG329_003105 [Mollisiaceae sp. DMI_Dod_QoI]|nr:hypothetical protein EG329_003105 [Helotiales sp. DMI_Dod_QoI]